MDAPALHAGFVLNVRQGNIINFDFVALYCTSWLLAYVWHIRSNVFNPLTDGLTITISSAYAILLNDLLPMWHPTLLRFNCSCKSFMYVLNNIGDSTLPCLTPHLTVKLFDIALSHLIQNVWIWYHTSKILTVNVGQPLSNILWKRVQWFTRSNAFVASRKKQIQDCL